jgi:hypothetical protein
MIQYQTGKNFLQHTLLMIFTAPRQMYTSGQVTQQYKKLLQCYELKSYVKTTLLPSVLSKQNQTERT